MNNKSIQRSVRAFTLVEMLGVIAIIATLGTVSIISIKDAVQAGQKAAVQREVQTLNTALQNFKSAGGVIQENATVTQVINALKVGTNLEGSNFAPLTSDPQLTWTIAGEEYNLTYHFEDGFS
jgi:type II secretory pathway pseudopilin PulG